MIGSLSQDVGQYPMIEISNSGYCFHRKTSRFASVSEEITQEIQQNAIPKNKKRATQ
jgi:hypothetical protein